MDTKKTILILDGSKQPYLNIGCRFGGVTIQGMTYTYIPEHDAFLRVDWMRKYTLHTKLKGKWQDFVEQVKQEK